MDDDLILIGDYIGTIEEFVPGRGTYTEEGKIYASTIGKKFVDREKHIAMVEGKFPPEVTEGQTVFGGVLKMSKNVVTVIVSKIQGVKGIIDVKAGIYVSNIGDGYVEKPDDMFGIGDIVKAKVVKIETGLVDLATKGPDFGVVKAFCKRCRFEMVKSKKFEGKMECPSCGRRESRKISKDYGNVSVL